MMCTTSSVCFNKHFFSFTDSFRFHSCLGGVIIVGGGEYTKSFLMSMIFGTDILEDRRMRN